MYQEGLCFQAGFFTSWVNASVEIGTCDIAINSASSRGMSAAKSATKCGSSIHQNPLLSDLNAVDAWGRGRSVGGGPCTWEPHPPPPSSEKAAMKTGATRLG